MAEGYTTLFFGAPRCGSGDLARGRREKDGGGCCALGWKGEEDAEVRWVGEVDGWTDGSEDVGLTEGEGYRGIHREGVGSPGLLVFNPE